MQIAPYLHGDILEVGAGIGATTILNFQVSNLTWPLRIGGKAGKDFPLASMSRTGPAARLVVLLLGSRSLPSWILGNA